MVEVIVKEIKPEFTRDDAEKYAKKGMNNSSSGL
jgi:hypothetical protein